MSPAMQVTLERHGEDDYGRTIGTLELDERSINQETVTEGWAWQYVYFDKSVELRTEQDSAKKMKLGLRADKDSTPPWEFMRSKPR